MKVRDIHAYTHVWDAVERASSHDVGWRRLGKGGPLQLPREAWSSACMKLDLPPPSPAPYTTNFIVITSLLAPTITGNSSSTRSLPSVRHTHHHVGSYSFPPPPPGHALRLPPHPSLAPGQCIPPPGLPHRRSCRQGRYLLQDFCLHYFQSDRPHARHREPEHA